MHLPVFSMLLGPKKLEGSKPNLLLTADSQNLWESRLLSSRPHGVAH